MGKDSNILLGLIIGAIIAIALLNKKSNTVSAQTTQPQLAQSSGIDWQPINIPRVDDIIKTQQIEQMQMAQTQIKVYDTKLSQIESQLEKTTLNLEQASSKLLELNNIISKIQEKQQIQQIAPIQPFHPVFVQPQTPQVIVHPIENRQQPVQPVQPVQVPQPIKSQIENIEKPNNTNNPSKELQDTIYKNNEKWDIKRGPDGRIKSLNIIRDVKKWEK